MKIFAICASLFFINKKYNLLFLLLTFLFQSCWTFYFVKCTPKCILALNPFLHHIWRALRCQNAMLNILRSKMYAKIHFCKALNAVLCFLQSKKQSNCWKPFFVHSIFAQHSHHTNVPKISKRKKTLFNKM